MERQLYFFVALLFLCAISVLLGLFSANPPSGAFMFLVCQLPFSPLLAAMLAPAGGTTVHFGGCGVLAHLVLVPCYFRANPPSGAPIFSLISPSASCHFGAPGEGRRHLGGCSVLACVVLVPRPFVPPIPPVRPPFSRSPRFHFPAFWQPLWWRQGARP